MKKIILIAVVLLAGCSPITTSDQDLLPLNGLTDLSPLPFLGLGAVDIASQEIQAAPSHSEKALSATDVDQRAFFFGHRPQTEIENAVIHAEAPVDFLAGQPGVLYMPRCNNLDKGT